MRRLALVLLATVAAFGCTTTVNEGAYPAQRVEHPQVRTRLNNVELLDASIANKVEVQRSAASRTATDTVEVVAMFRNRTSYPLNVECRTTFYGKNEIPVDGPSAWQRVFLEPNGLASYRESSTKLDVAYYHVEVREGR